ncbi:DUF2508 family protein [Paenibacillus sp. SYP-B3998]|uniref:DUF2508 family protein n=1 Tax=Paenibacillus sp. SYP-B3998 TaxID=2678564 RepID=UPI0031F9DC8C
MKPALQSTSAQDKKKVLTKLDKELIKKDKQMLVAEIRIAHQSWLAAQAHFEFAVEKGQVDYAIYALEAAEKRFEMLIKQAKELRINLSDSDH